jgi:hypothetical protein
MQLKTIIEALSVPALEQRWVETLAEWSDAPAGEADACRKWVCSLRDEFLQAAIDIDDEETLDTVTAVRYIELKSCWIMLNTQIGYRVAVKGINADTLAYKASLVSQLLECIEGLLDAEILERILSFLAEPIGGADL